MKLFFSIFIFSVVLFSGGTVFGQAQGSSCSVNGRTQVSSVPSEGLIQCRSGVWSSTTQNMSGSESKAVIQYDRMLVITVDNCTDDNIGFVGFDPDTGLKMICGGSLKGWKELKSSSSFSGDTETARVFSVGMTHMCGTTPSNVVWCWGDNSSGQLGSSGSATLNIINDFKFVLVGGNSTCGIKTNDTLWCWGDNSNGQLGDGTTTAKSVPTQVQGGGTWKILSLATSGTYSCGIKTDNTLWCWGVNDSSQLGNGNNSQQNSPVQVSGGGSWKAVHNSETSACGIKSDDTLWCWGQPGGNMHSPSSVPVRVIWE